GITTAALAGETRQAAEASAQRDRAEANVNLSLDAFEEIFDTLARRDEALLPFRGKPFERPAVGQSATADEGDAALLQSILAFYHRFAEQNDTNPKLQLEAARAHRRVAEIRQRFGQAAEAVAARRQATDMLQALIRDDPSSPEYSYELVLNYATMNFRLLSRDELEEAERGLQQAIALAQQLKERAPQPP